MAINATDQTFNDYKDVLDKNDIPDGTARAETKLSDYKGKGLARWNKKCVLLQQEKAYKVYQSLNETIGIFAQKDAGEIRKKIDLNIDANSKKVLVKLNETTKAVKEARTKLEILKKKGEEMDTAANSHAMSVDLAAIIKLVGDKAATSDHFIALKDLSKAAYEKSDDTAEVAIRVTGIHASANIESLKPLGVDIEKATTDLQADLVKNIKDTNAMAATTREEYQNIMQQLVTAKYSWYESQLSFLGVLDIRAKVENPNCPEDITKKLDELQAELENSYNPQSTTDETPEISETLD